MPVKEHETSQIFEKSHLIFGKSRLQYIFDILKGSIDDLIIVGETIGFQGM